MYGLGIVILALAACGFAAQDPATITLSSTDNGKTVKVKTGQAILLQLPVQWGTGFSWQPPRSDKRDSFIVEKEKPASGAAAQLENKPGTTELQVFRVLFKQAGPFDIGFEYRRPWDEKTAPIHTFRLKAEVQK